MRACATTTLHEHWRDTPPTGRRCAVRCDSRGSVRVLRCARRLLPGRIWFRSGPTPRCPARPRWGAAELSTFVERVRAGAGEISQVEGRYSALLAQTVEFWDVESDPLAVEFRLEWRARRAEELNARHIIDFSVEGPERDEDGVYTWRYGSPFAVRLRLAKDSPLRFADATDASGLERRVAYPGNGALIRALSSLDPRGMWSFSGVLVDAAGARQDLRISARFERRDGAALRAPAFGLAIPVPSAGDERLRHVDLTTTEELLLRFQPAAGR